MHARRRQVQSFKFGSTVGEVLCRLHLLAIQSLELGESVGRMEALFVLVLVVRIDCGGRVSVGSVKGGGERWSVTELGEGSVAARWLTYPQTERRNTKRNDLGNSKQPS